MQLKDLSNLIMQLAKQKEHADWHYIEISFDYLFDDGDYLEYLDQSVYLSILTIFVKEKYSDIVENSDHGDFLENLTKTNFKYIEYGFYMISKLNGFEIVNREYSESGTFWPNKIFKSITDFHRFDYWDINEKWPNPKGKGRWYNSHSEHFNVDINLPENFRDIISNPRMVEGKFIFEYNTVVYGTTTYEILGVEDLIIDKILDHIDRVNFNDGELMLTATGPYSAIMDLSYL